MSAGNMPASNNNSKGKKRKFLPHGKPVRKGLYPLRPGVQGFFITCDGGRERQAMNEALNILESFYDELVHGLDPGGRCRTVPSEPVNKIIKFKDSDSSSGEDESPAEDKDEKEHNEKSKKSIENEKGKGEDEFVQEEDDQYKKHARESDCTLVKRQCLEKDSEAFETTEVINTKTKPIDELIEDELNELGDRNKRHFVSLDSGCNGCIFIQMHKRLKDPSPTVIAQHMISSVASTKRHISRFILRALPAEITCYASEEEISKSVQPLIAEYFPANASTPLKFAVLYEARSNTGIDRMTIINAVAKSVPQPHKVDLKKPDKTIIVQIAKTICMVGVVERYRELAKYNLRQLTSPQSQPEVATEQGKEARRAGNEPAEESQAECYWYKDTKSLLLKLNTKIRYVPTFVPSQISYNVASIFLHPEDLRRMEETSELDPGMLSAHMNMGVVQISKFLCEKATRSEEELKRLTIENAKLAEGFIKYRDLANRFKDDATILGAQLKQAKADHELALLKEGAERATEAATAADHLQKVKKVLDMVRAQKKAAEERLYTEREEAARREKIDKETIRLLKASSSRMIATPFGPQQTKEEIIAEYKKSDEFGYHMKDFGEYRFDLLRRHLSKNQMLSKEQLKSLDYKTCIDEASDEESDNR